MFPLKRIDERITMFSRAELKKGNSRYTAFYNSHPDLEQKDNRFRKLPGLLSKDALFYDETIFKRAQESFSEIDGIQHLADNNRNEKQSASTPLSATDIENWLLENGALSTGIAQMQPYHWYSFGGRKERYDKVIIPKHPYGIAFTVEMDKAMVDEAPKAPIVAESARQYLQAAKLATALAEKIRQAGFDARAHIDGNYEVVCPLVARDANLGEIGRMGLLIASQVGPRCRIAVVTTNMHLDVTPRKYNPAIEVFCEKCKKCVHNCPVGAIPNSKKNVSGIQRWQINSEKCYTYWCKIGTDCGKCMKVCPYSHPNNFLHNKTRHLLNVFPNLHTPAIKLDNWFYR